MKRLVAGIIICMAAVGCNSALNETLCRVSFSSSFTQEVKSKSPLSNGTISNLYLYKSGEGYTTNITKGVLLEAKNYGEMESSKELYLPKGYYNIFSLSANKTTLPPSLLGNPLTIELTNGVDYIWSEVKNRLIENDLPIPLLYKHLCSKLDILVVPPPNFQNFIVERILLTLPNTSGTTLDVPTGTINPSQTLSPLTVIEGEGNSRTLYIVPCSAALSIEVYITAKVAGQTLKGVEYKGVLPMQPQGGTHYSVVLNLNSIYSSSITINVLPWVSYNSDIVYTLVKREM